MEDFEIWLSMFHLGRIRSEYRRLLQEREG